MISSQLLTARPQPQKQVVAIALVLFATGAVALSAYGWRQSILFLVGGLLGISLYHSRFGFASAYRKLFVSRDVRGMYAQLAMLAIATVLFVPVLATGAVFGQEVQGAVAPVGIQGAIGAFLFGIGMQLGGGCGCGTLYTIGSGSLSMLLTLITFCVGAFWASLTRQLWAGLPATPAVSLGQTWGWVGAVCLQLVLFLLLAGCLWWWSSRGRGEEESQKSKVESQKLNSSIQNPKSKIQNSPDSRPCTGAQLCAPTNSLIYGPWSLLMGAVALAVLNWLTLLLSGQPWRVTWGFAVWSAQLASALGWNPGTSPFWSNGAGQQALSQSIFADVSSVMNFGIILGAVLAAGLAGRLVPKAQFSWSALAATGLGGLIMGYGAFIAFGCNVSAFFGGIASTSLHGWVWIASALLGTAIGIRLRPLFRLSN
ncbi:MAG: hypothetical protein CLLPBCKN_005985 [Chroococcidiopsis cubana SAG 39.79]|uniref:Membrane protein n=1 Tax=Chroococcidiopsis cubana SAG 39.79 TaxID=388085 RepID=A0AB37U9L4_9CYAN|nr:YeeE/YedE family protein [Chroococcidiopsis cubana]MDZ4876550.1 hypothetical protein [Chroococcidiopsis cubana SAG 39.79]PSB63803.1 YeeE/YedE family protein [Chroococcidiopsis cubana CCALA 043]RUT00275.1 membrane protein [Chroococcidiopsis cubana SAG 39.79]